MDYIFYTPPNTEPKIPLDLEFDRTLALLEGKHYMATSMLQESGGEVDRILDASGHADPESERDAVKGAKKREQGAFAELRQHIEGLEREIISRRAELDIA